MAPVETPLSSHVAAAPSPVGDAFAMRKIDHLKFFVGNARQSCYFYRNCYGFEVVAYSGLETGSRNEAAYVVRQGTITFVLVSPIRPNHPEAYRLAQHGDGVCDIAIDVEDVEAAFNEAVKRGAVPAKEPTKVDDGENGVWEYASIKAYGDTTHTFVNRSAYKGIFAPGFKALEPGRYDPSTFHSVGLKEIDHAVTNVAEGQMNEWVQWYAKVLGFSQLISFDDKDISTEYSALMSKVMQNGAGRIKLPINEPAPGKKKSQIDEYLEFYGGPGIQHIALATDDIISTVTALKKNDCSFLTVPSSYYDQLEERVGKLDEDISVLRDLGILVDKDDEGYLLQIFTKPVADRPTVFFEIIQRKGSRSFGKGNFLALFTALEAEQEKRGNL
ncbi:4-hydroxyphenylpyruvate dioxygenase [Hyaloraphidium curvatum]|nr:4-hydroxyphenylpyruvate dioxygenase [Hyaloraphidium curvatum]